MAKITRKQVDDINARLLNGWKFDTRHFILNGEKSVTMEIPLDEKYELSASISFYDSYECFEKIGTVVKIRVSKWKNIGNGMISSCDWGKSRAIAYTKPRKMFKDIEILTAFITKEDIMEIYNGTEETAEITNIRMNSKGLWERVRENSGPMPEAVAEITPEAGNLKPTKKRINALQQIVKANKGENRVAIQTEKAQFFGNGFTFVMLVASCFITPISEFFSNVADGFHHMARTFMNTVKAAEAETGEKLQLPTLQELKEIKRVCKLNDGKSIVDFGEKMPCIKADFLQKVLESLSGKVEAWKRGKYNIYLKDEYGNVSYIMGIQLKPEVKREFWKNTLERNRKLEEELRKQEQTEKQENSVEKSTPTTEKPTSAEEQPESENSKGESIMNNMEIPTIKNLSQLKKALKANSGMMFEILDCYNPERIGEIRKVTSVNSINFTSRAINESGEMTGKDIYAEFRKACDWKFEGEKISHLFTTGDVIMSFRFITENSIMNDNSIMSKYNTEEQPTTENLTAETPATEQPEEAKTAWTGKADYAERRAEKAERYAERAEKARATADRLQKPINDMHGDIAFFTQPNINTSAGRAFTRQREKMLASYEKGFEERAKAAYYDEKSENLSKEPTAISSDDPEALHKLKDKLEKLTAEHKEHLAHNKALNKAIKDGTAETNKFGWATLNGKSYYFTTNEAAEIRRLKDRIEELENLEVPENYSFGGGTVVFNTAENRVQILFGEIPDSETRENLKRNGFKWSPRQKAWQRMLNTTGIRTAKRLYPRPIEEPAPAEENSYEEIKIMNDNNTNTKYNTELTENPEPTAEEFIMEIFANLKEGAGIETHHFWELAEKAGFEKGGVASNALSKLTYVDDIRYDGKYSYSVFRLKTPTTAEEEENFLKADATDFLIHCNYAWDEIEDFSYDFYDGKYESIEKAAKSANGFRDKEFIIYNGKISGKTYYADSKKDIKELSANKTESGIQISFGNVSKLVTFKEIEEKLVDIIRTEYPPEEFETENPEPTAEPVQENSQAEMDRITAERNRYLEYMQNLYAEKGNSVPPEKWNEMWGKIGEYNSKLAEIESRIPLAYTGETEKITVDDVEIKTEKTPEITLEYNGNSEQIKALKDYVLSLGATVSSTENCLTIDTYENHRPEIESVATELGLQSDEEMHKTFNAVQGKINEVGTIEQKNIIYKIPWGIYRRYSAEDITNVVLARTNDILAIKTENRLKAISALIDSVAPMATDKLIDDNTEKSGATADSAEENSADNSTVNGNNTTAERKIRPPPFLKDFPKIRKEKR